MIIRWINEEAFLGLFVSDQVAEDTEISHLILSDKHAIFSVTDYFAYIIYCMVTRGRPASRPLLFEFRADLNLTPARQAIGFISQSEHGHHFQNHFFAHSGFPRSRSTKRNTIRACQ
jgi:hypothetical protein